MSHKYQEAIGEKNKKVPIEKQKNITFIEPKQLKIPQDSKNNIEDNISEDPFELWKKQSDVPQQLEDPFADYQIAKTTDKITNKITESDKAVKKKKKILPEEKPQYIDCENLSQIFSSDKLDKTSVETEISGNIKPSKKVPVKKNQKTVFFVDNDMTKPVTAGGVVLYKNKKGKMHILIEDSQNKYEDIGGKVDPTDRDIYHTVARETEEETHGLIKETDLLDRLKKADTIYVPISKYLIFIVEANKYEAGLKKENFGDKESHDGFDRTIGWILKEDLLHPSIIKLRLNWRIRSKGLFDKLREIEEDMKFKTPLFRNQSTDQSADDSTDQ